VKLFDRLKHLSFYRSLIQASHLLTAQFFIQLLGVASFLVYTHLFPPEDFGIVSLFYSFASILLSISTFHIHDTVYRYFYENKDDFRKYLASALIMVAVIFLIAATIILLFKGWIFGVLIKNFPPYLLLPLFLYALSTFFYVFTGNVLMAKRNTKRAAINSVLYNYLKFGLGVFFVILVVSPALSTSRIWGETMATFILGAIMFLYVFKSADFSLTKSHFHTHRKYAQNLALPFLFLGFSDMILGAFDQWFINNYFGNYDTGIYSFGYKIGALLVGISQAIMQGNGNDYYENMNSASYEKVAVQSRTIMKLVALASIGLMFFSNDIVVLLARREAYYAAIPIVPIVVMGYFFHAIYSMYARNFIYAKKAGILTLLMLTAGIINIFLNFMFVPQFGYIAAAYTTLVSYLLIFIAIVLIDNKMFGYNNIKISYQLPVILITIGCFIAAFFMSSWWGWGPFILKVLIYGAIFLFLFADRIKDALMPSQNSGE